MLPDKTDVLVIGGGAAGLMASVSAAESGCDVVCIEKNEKLGKKIYITGKGRCNFTNACDTEDIFSQVVTNAKFLYSSIYGFSNHDVINWFSGHGLNSHVERGGRLFPDSGKASDVTKTLEKACRDAGVDICLDTEADTLLTDHDGKKMVGVRLKDDHEIGAKAVVIATGGLSYPSTGSTGDGYRMAAACGHRVTELKPALTGIQTREDFVRQMQGLTLINTDQRILDVRDGKEKCLLKGFGEILFTHFGVSGPTMLTASSILGDTLRERELILVLDIKPALDRKQLDARLLREIDQNGKKSIANIMRSLLPKSMIPVLLKRIGIDEEKRGLDLTRDERLAIVDGIKDFRLTLIGTRDFNEAVITRGGIDVKQIDPHTMESKIISGLYFAGEVIDVDALTGGYNLQIAWSTGHAAGTAAGGGCI